MKYQRLKTLGESNEDSALRIIMQRDMRAAAAAKRAAAAEKRPLGQLHATRNPEQLGLSTAHKNPARSLANSPMKGYYAPGAAKRRSGGIA